MEWWYCGPVVLAVIMFLLVGTVFEQRIERAWYQFMEHRRSQIAAMVAQDQLSAQVNQPTMTCNAAPTPTQTRPETPCADSILSPCADSVPPPAEAPITVILTEVPVSTVNGKSETTAAKTPSRKSLRSRKSATILSRQSVVVVKT